MATPDFSPELPDGLNEEGDDIIFDGLFACRFRVD